ncbi:MAG: sterol desaturase family protein [Thermoleophilaceae bacterium]|nr:sterol desaturase family protein [Thermoleophilaceae bacterium]
MAHAHAHPNEHATSVPADYDERLTAERDDLKSLGNCFKEFMRHFSGRAVAVAIVAVLGVRIALGEFSYRDLIVPLLLLTAQPFVEWFIHTYLLHLKPFEIGGRKFDLYTARAHRRHHKDPAIIERTLLHPQEILGSMFLIALTAAPIAAGIVYLVFGGSFVPLYFTSLFFSYVGLYRYEWSHFLIHTPYIPKTRFFRSIWRSHRLHHYKHEDYWMGVTSNFGDRVLHTFPDQKTIEKSPTARTLGVETEDYDREASA